MTERPIIFSGPMVRAIIEGRKTQTRRMIKPAAGHEKWPCGWWPMYINGRRCGEGTIEPSFCSIPARDGGAVYSGATPHCPDDKLWVRETWSSPYRYAEFRPRDCGGPFWYWADGNPTDGDWSRPRPSIHMPKWAARIWLTVTEVRVQRLHDISRGDCMSEGCPFANMTDGPDPRDWFRELWDSIHGSAAWDRNPLVAAITFKRAKR